MVKFLLSVGCARLSVAGPGSDVEFSTSSTFSAFSTFLTFFVHPFLETLNLLYLL